MLVHFRETQKRALCNDGTSRVSKSSATASRVTIYPLDLQQSTLERVPTCNPRFGREIKSTQFFQLAQLPLGNLVPPKREPSKMTIPGYILSTRYIFSRRQGSPCTLVQRRADLIHRSGGKKSRVHLLKQDFGLLPLAADCNLRVPSTLYARLIWCRSASYSHLSSSITCTA